jgi:DNA-directed RNA polymerase specialized sigma24 family protein
MTSSFQPTHWTLVVRSQGGDTTAKAALSELCTTYYTPVIAFLKREGRSEDAAREIAHGFFQKLLAGGALEKADQERGRFRSYLLGALKHYLTDQRDRTMAEKRGGGVEHIYWNTPSSTSASGLQLTDEKSVPPDLAFDRQWAITVLDDTLHDLESEMRSEGKIDLFKLIKPWLTGDADATSQASIAAQLGMSADSVKTAVHRLRKRFRTLMKKRISDTLEDSAQTEEELTHLKMALL